MLLEDQTFLEMMQMVPACSLPQSFVTESKSNISNYDFDLDLLPFDAAELQDLFLHLPTTDYSTDYYYSGSRSSCYYQQQVPSPTNTLSPLEASVHSPTMFSPVEQSSRKSQPNFGAAAASAASTAAAAASSSCVRQRSTPPSYSSSSPSYNLQESLAEFQESQNKVKFEQEFHVPPPPYSVGGGQTKATVQIKIEPVESGGCSSECCSPSSSSATPELQKVLADRSFVSRHDLKPFDFGITTGFASRSSGSRIISHPEQQQHVPIPPPPAYPKQEMVEMEPVLSLAMEQVRKDISATCQALNIVPDPNCWSKSDVSKWLQWTMQQYNISVASPQRSVAIRQWAELGGAGFAHLAEQDFKQHFQQDGELLHAQLYIWRSAAGFQRQQQQQQQQLHRPVKKEDSFDISYVLQMLDNKEEEEDDQVHHHHQQQPHYGGHQADVEQQHSSSAPPPPPPPYPVYGSEQQQQQQHPRSVSGSRPSISASETDYGSEAMDEDDEDDNDAECSSSSRSPPVTSASSVSTTVAAIASTSAAAAAAAAAVVPVVPITGGRSSSSIHLWQFVKELLNQPHLHSGCIHWIDQGRGIFKIVDSHRVASLWGKRKNRPAMNYDKLSRSLRQYYKKGIMKKTERTQRLVYQFCTPYHL